MRFVPFKPRILRFDEEHAAVRGPAGGAAIAPPDASLVRATAPHAAPGDDAPAAPHDPAYDTVRGMELDTIRDWDPDDALLADPQLQCLARQLSDDAAALAARYPADGWIPPAIESAAVPASKMLFRGSRQRWRAGFTALSRCAAVIACVTAVILALPQVVDDRPASTRPASTRPASTNVTATTPTSDEVRWTGRRSGTVDAFVADRATFAPLSAVDSSRGRTRFEDGDTAEWGAKVIDDSQFGPGGFGIDGLPIDALPIETDALRDLMPSDSQDYCDVSM
jgi:hypothetical protein